MPNPRHYERAFHAYLRSLRVSCNLVNESSRSADADETIKSFDFLVYGAGGRKLLIDIKGRRLEDRRSTLENWTTLDDVRSLLRWQEVFGADSISLLVFAYHLATTNDKIRFDDTYLYQDRRYGFLAIDLADYQRFQRLRSPKWGTVHIPQASFREYSKPISRWLSSAEVFCCGG